MYSLFAKKEERSFSSVPRQIVVVFILCFGLQALHHTFFNELKISEQKLPKALDGKLLLLPFLSDNSVAARITMLWLQAFDNQPGISIPFANLDYHRLTDWLTNIQSLDEKSHYALLSASRLYGQVPDNEKKRLMLDFVKRQYLASPDTRWRWMAHAVYIAKHQLKDLDLALEFAELIRLHTPRDKAPPWVTQMEIFILEDMDEIESAKVLIGGLLESGEIKDEHELNFLLQRLEELEEE